MHRTCFDIDLLFVIYPPREQCQRYQKIAGEYTIVIDAGHGGKDAGAIGVDGSNEKTINLQIAECLYDFCDFRASMQL